ncbi:hypothetical protein BS50DRAFT_596778 [Corynespora cassiicola Philippines]|uniref:Uncharacterized protein n=1 Tax=Corynespora cassiicola Philippines TaxID=1448308 RepID=A0A2T2P5T9_CORCC|nr:hypothetical protein BS50DRAFT_596778 [Corynespora cassiicola Philippines]
MTLIEAIRNDPAIYDEGEIILNPQRDYNGWANPEDLTPMPQCIAQQDQSAWLNVMTRCTGKQCTSHFGIICTHHQWLTQRSCLSVEFSPDVIRDYLPYCSRSILALAQLYQWINEYTGRTWLVDVGDANELHNLSPASLSAGYEVVDIAGKAPTCLIGSSSSRSMESFHRVMASCSFTGTSEHTGNAARPWEYRESAHSMVALDYETVGYNLTHRSITNDDYFDINCFCSTYILNKIQEPCPDPQGIDLTKERLWMNATCGPASLPDNWTDMIKTTTFAYIPTEDWKWPKCVHDMPRRITSLTDQCTTDACELDSKGYCRVKRSIDRACVCRDISYQSCGGSCHMFEMRMDYVKWLHDLCGDVEGWHNMPDDWRRLAAPTTLDMIPWNWSLKPFLHSDLVQNTSPDSIETTQTCQSNEGKLASFAFVNLVSLLAIIYNYAGGKPMIVCRLSGWFFPGIFLAALQLLANWINAFLVQNTPGYEDVPVIELILLWCTMPRLTWLATLLVRIQPFESTSFSAAASSLFAEFILQLLSAYYMITTVSYGLEHSFYLGSLDGAERGGSAKMMYDGALLWLFVVLVALAFLVPAIVRLDEVTESGRLDSPNEHIGKRSELNAAEQMMAQMNEYCAWVGGQMQKHCKDEDGTKTEPLLKNKKRVTCTDYGTLSIEPQHYWAARRIFAGVYAIMALSMICLCIAQCLFWVGFIGLAGQEFCPPKLGTLTIVWTTFSLLGTAVGDTQ